MIAPPETPPDRVRLLREAYAKALNDRDLLAEAKKSNMELDPSTGDEQEAIMKEVVNQPPEVVQKIKKLLGE